MPTDSPHNHPEFADLIRIVAKERGIAPALVKIDDVTPSEAKDVSSWAYDYLSFSTSFIVARKPSTSAATITTM
jgi:hypothetical protein